MDNQALEMILRSLPQKISLLNKTEEATKQGAILPILSALGWNSFDVNEVTPEFSVGNGRVDYCLHIGQRRAIFVEVKRASQELEKHEKQLLEYAFEYGVEIAVLTNGLTWWLYLPLMGGTWEQRKFFSIDIMNQPIESVMEHFEKFLSKRAVASGEALRQAKEIKESREKHKLIKKALPKAWAQLLQEPDEFLLEVLSERVESICGYRPQTEILKDFIRTIAEKETKSVEFLESSERQKAPEPSSARIKSKKVKSRQKGTIVTINNRRFEASTIKELYFRVLKYLYDNGYIDKVKDKIPFATSRKRYLIAREPIHPGGNRFWVPIEYQGYFMETHKGYKEALKQLKSFVQECGLDISYE